RRPLGLLADLAARAAGGAVGDDGDERALAGAHGRGGRRLVGEPGDPRLVHGALRPTHAAPALAADDGGGALHAPPLPLVQPAARDPSAALVPVACSSSSSLQT